jgi:hypothetical protein
MIRGLKTPTALLLLMIFSASAVFSQDSAAVGREGGLRRNPGVLAGHAFIPSTFIRDPFVRTFFRTGLGFGSTLDYVPPATVVNGKTISGPTGDLLFALLEVEYQYAFRTWLAVRGRVNMAGRVADETPALVSQGVTLITGFELGWLMEISRSDRLAVSGSIGIKNTTTTDVYLQRFIEGIIEAGEILPANRLVLTTPTLRGTSSIQGTYVLSRLTGVTVSGTFDYGESMNRGASDQWYYDLSAAFDFNLYSHNGTPIGFVVGAKIGSAPDLEQSDDRTAQNFFGRVAYTGSSEFALGLDLGYELLPIRGMPEKQGFLAAVVDMRLYF